MTREGPGGEEDGFQPLDFRELNVAEMRQRARSFREEMWRRRTVRKYATRELPREVVEECVRTALSAPSGANRQPWHFVVVSDVETKRRIREAAEEEEEAFYRERAPDDWLEALAPLGTGPEKPFLEAAPYLIVIFAESYGVEPDGSKRKNYYVTESVGIATGMLVTALHHAGLATLTHTPSPMGFLNGLLGRPDNERAFLILVAGYPAADARVPVLEKKSFDDVVTFRDGA